MSISVSPTASEAAKGDYSNPALGTFPKNGQKNRLGEAKSSVYKVGQLNYIEDFPICQGERRKCGRFRKTFYQKTAQKHR